VARRDIVTLKLDKRAIAKLAHTAETKAVVEDRTKRIEAAAKRFAPVRHGAYRAGIKSTVEQTPDGWAGRVEGTHFTSSWIEFGTRRTRAFAPLRRAVDAVFGRIDDEGAP